MSDQPDNRRAPTGRRVSAAAYASNWWVVLAADAAVGLLVGLAGLAVGLWWNPWIGAALAVIGVGYVVLVARRALQWRWLRREAGR